EQALLINHKSTIRAHHACCAAHYILSLIRVRLWLAAFHPCMPFEHKETVDCLRPEWFNKSENVG
uniref:IS4 family transposase n=1 Tax=Mesocestoides corti TaxID=53468 RepID=A0A5K3ERD5_MESCO